MVNKHSIGKIISKLMSRLIFIERRQVSKTCRYTMPHLFKEL